MAKRPVTPARRKRRVFRDALVLAAALALLILSLDFPIFTAGQALDATQARFFFGPGEVVTSLDYPREPGTARGQYDRYYILRWGDWYAWCGVNHYGLFWQTGQLDAVENDPDLPLVPLVVSGRPSGAVLLISNDPEIAQVELTFPISAESTYSLFSVRETDGVENCFLVSFEVDAAFVFPEDLQVRGYNGEGELIYQSPVPESWATRYELR